MCPRGELAVSGDTWLSPLREGAVTPSGWSQMPLNTQQCTGQTTPPPPRECITQLRNSAGLRPQTSAPEHTPLKKLAVYIREKRAPPRMKVTSNLHIFCTTNITQSLNKTTSAFRKGIKASTARGVRLRDVQQYLDMLDDFLPLPLPSLPGLPLLCLSLPREL